MSLWLQLALSLGLLPVCWAASVPVSCGSIYKSFAGCLVTLGDSMGDSMGDTQKDSSTQDIDAICRSWNAFHVCASSALSGCPGDAAAVWESLRQESRKTEFSGNLYDLCASRTTLAPSTLPPSQGPPTSDQTNQETLKGHCSKQRPVSPVLLVALASLLLALMA
ncbi:neuritin 1-like b [Gadus morhua]|uniref:Neuritin 1-like b n=1 Tax=Gadus morhua TaxID=8049 RepID=A0A8C5C9N8_GADMO|nr:neuritin-like protein [Gadus morhua]